MKHLKTFEKFTYEEYDMVDENFLRNIKNTFSTYKHFTEEELIEKINTKKAILEKKGKKLNELTIKGTVARMLMGDDNVGHFNIVVKNKETGKGETQGAWKNPKIASNKGNNGTGQALLDSKISEILKETNDIDLNTIIKKYI